MALGSVVKVLSDQRASLAMVFVQCLYAGMALLSKAALDKGLSHFVFVAYRQATAAMALAPFACAMERSKAPPLSLGVFCKIFLLSLFGLTLSMDLFYFALRYTSATFASTANNMIPVITFLISILFRIEKVDLRTAAGRLKILGATVCVGGAIALSLYQGPPLKLFVWRMHTAGDAGGRDASHSMQQNFLLKGPLLMIISYTAWSLWFIMQGAMLKVYPAKLRLSTLQCLLSSIQSALTSLAFNRDSRSWVLTWDIQLLSILYCGVLMSGFSYWLQIWCMEKKGPVYVIMFSPLSPIMTAIISAIIWAEALYCGSVLGGFLIVGGLFCVVWGKSWETKTVEGSDGADEAVIDPSRAPRDKLADEEKGQSH